MMHPLLAIALLVPAAQAGVCGNLNQRLASIDEECCDEPTESCTDGKPQYCNDDCASIFLDVWSDCKEDLRRALGSKMGSYDKVVTMCYQTEMSPCKLVPCLNGGKCHGHRSGHRRFMLEDAMRYLESRNTSAPPAPRRQLQSSVVCVCPPGFKGSRCEQCSQTGMDPNYYCLRPLAKPTKSKYCKDNPDLCCQFYVPNIANAMRHVLDLSSIRRLVERTKDVATALSQGDWSISPKIDAHCSKVRLPLAQTEVTPQWELPWSVHRTCSLTDGGALRLKAFQVQLRRRRECLQHGIHDERRKVLLW
jgi:hypothetical protein